MKTITKFRVTYQVNKNTESSGWLTEVEAKAFASKIDKPTILRCDFTEYEKQEIVESMNVCGVKIEVQKLNNLFTVDVGGSCMSLGKQFEKLEDALAEIETYKKALINYQGLPTPWRA